MGDFKNGVAMKVFTSFLGILIIAINVFFVAQNIGNLPSAWYVYFAVGIAAILYLFFVLYLTVYLMICLGWEELATQTWIQKLYHVDGFLVKAQISDVTVDIVKSCSEERF